MDAILKEADILRKKHPSKDVRFFAESVYRELSNSNACRFHQAGVQNMRFCPLGVTKCPEGQCTVVYGNDLKHP